jgi:hypothetical protein
MRGRAVRRYRRLSIWPAKGMPTDAEPMIGTMDLALSLVYSVLFLALLALSYLSIWRRKTRN